MAAAAARTGRPGVSTSGDREYGDQVNQAAVVAATPGSPTARPRIRRAPVPVVPLDAPSMRPDEAVTAGLSLGPGPGPEVMPARYSRLGSDELHHLRAYYRQHPTEAIRRIIARAELEA